MNRGGGKGFEKITSNTVGMRERREGGKGTNTLFKRKKVNRKKRGHFIRVRKIEQ